MIPQLARSITTAQAKKPWVFIGLFAIITLALLPGITLLLGNVEPSLEKVLPQHVDEVAAMNHMRTQFGADMMYVVFTADGLLVDATTPEAMRYLDTIEQRLITNDRILDVRSPASTVKATYGHIPDDQARINEALTKHDLLDPDKRLAVLEVRADTGPDPERIEEAMQAINDALLASEAQNPGFTTQVTGFNAIDKATFDVIINDFTIITGIAFALVALVVYLTFRSIKNTLLPLTVVLVALLWTLGIAGYAQVTITVVSMVSAAMIMGLGIDFGIHTVHTYNDYRKKQPPRQALGATLNELLRALAAASLTTSAGFLALVFGVLPAMKTLGILLAIGIMTTFLAAVLLLLPLLYVTERRTP